MKLKHALIKIISESVFAGPNKIFDMNQVDENSVIKKPSFRHNCYMNARREFIKRRKSGESVDYYLGVIKNRDSEKGIPHAWVVKNNTVIDPTPTLKGHSNEMVSFKEEYPDAVYVGRKMDPNFVIDAEKNKVDWGLGVVDTNNKLIRIQ